MRKTRKIIPIIAALVVVLFSAATLSHKSLEEKDYSECLKKYSSKWGEKCLQCSNYVPNSYTVYYRNTCTETLDVKCAVQESNKQWRFFLRNDIAPNDSVVVYACDGTGKSLYWARKAGDKRTSFPTDKEINDEYIK